MDMSTRLADEFWDDCELVARDAEVLHGAPVFKGTRLDVESVIGAVDAYIELKGLTENEAIEAVDRDYDTSPGPEAIREVLAYFDAHTRLQPQL